MADRLSDLIAEYNDLRLVLERERDDRREQVRELNRALHPERYQRREAQQREVKIKSAKSWTPLPTEEDPPGY